MKTRLVFIIHKILVSMTTKVMSDHCFIISLWFPMRKCQYFINVSYTFPVHFSKNSFFFIHLDYLSPVLFYNTTSLSFILVCFYIGILNEKLCRLRTSTCSLLLLFLLLLESSIKCEVGSLVHLTRLSKPWCNFMLTLSLAFTILPGT